MQWESASSASPGSEERGSAPSLNKSCAWVGASKGFVEAVAWDKVEPVSGVLTKPVDVFDVAGVIGIKSSGIFSNKRERIVGAVLSSVIRVELTKFVKVVVVKERVGVW